MSRLYHSEEGRVIPTLCEEVTAVRRVRKQIELPGTRDDVQLYVLARCYPENRKTLEVAVNGQAFTIAPAGAGAYHWHELTLPASVIRDGWNDIELWTDTAAMNGWSLAMEAGHGEPRSYVTDDDGRTWRNRRMGYLNALRGEYVVRLRLSEGRDPVPPDPVREDPESPRLQQLRGCIPAEARADQPVLSRVRALSGWIASSWEHVSEARAAQYAPWDPATILAWAREGRGHDGRAPIVMCAHYAVAFLCCCEALGIPARLVIMTGGVNGHVGHFVAEVWMDDPGKWVMVDPNTDSMVRDGGVLLSMAEIRERRHDLSGLIEWGAGTEYQRRFPHMEQAIREMIEPGVCFTHYGIWPRTDLLTRPDLSPPCHGALAYCETGIVWHTEDRDMGFGMFPLFADQAYFDAPPPGVPATPQVR